MCRLAFIITNLIIYTSAKFEGDSNDLNQIPEIPESSDVNGAIYDNAQISEQNKLWVLRLNNEGLDSLVLRRGTDQDEKDFDFYAGPSIAEFKNRQNNVVKKNASRVINSDGKIVEKKEIFKYLNKFALYSKTEPDSNLSDSHEADEPSISLYFKGQFTSLIVTLGMRQWHYFISPPASWFPSWFYEEHTTEIETNSVKIPDDIRDKLFSALLRLLQVILRYPL